MNSTFINEQSMNEQESGGSREMSIDGALSLIEKESPPQYVTQRKEKKSDMQELRADFRSMVSTMERWFAVQDVKFNRMIEDFTELKTTIKFVSDSYEDLKAKTEDVTQRVAVLEQHNIVIQDNSLKIEVLEAKLDMMEQQARQNNAEISNLPEKRGEDLVAILGIIVELAKFSIAPQDVVTIHRVPQANTSSRPKNVVVRFSSRMLRDNFLSAVRLHKGITTEQLNMSGQMHRIYINEHLTLKNKMLFRKTRETAKQYGHRFVWIKHGNILVRQHEKSAVFTVRSEIDLAKFNVSNK